MIRYKLAALAPKKGRSKVLLRGIEESLGARRSYLAGLRRLLAGIAALVRETVIDRYALELSREALTRDMGADEGWFAALISRTAALVRVAEAMVERILRLESIRHTARFRQSAKRALGVDLEAVVRQEDLSEALRAMIGRNVSLIRNLADDAIKRVEQAVYGAVIAGEPVSALRKRLNKDFGVLDSRARLIASDQLSKANADLNRLRHEQAGVTSYRWQTSEDERVRPLHSKLNGREYRYGEPTGAEQGLPPGQPVRCRCVAVGIVEL